MVNFSSLDFVLISTLIAMLSSILGASCTFFIKNNLNKKYYKLFLGFTSGIMISSSIWSLLIPATEVSTNKINSLVSISIGFILGATCFKIIDNIISSVFLKTRISIPISIRKKGLIILSATLRNLIEGISIGIAFSIVDLNNFGSFAGAISLSISMSLQNLPEGFALSIPFKKEGFSNVKSFLIASIPGLLEPIGGIIGLYLATKLMFALPSILSFAAGAIIITVIDEIIPEYNTDYHKIYGTFGFTLGFLLLLILDIILK